MYLSENVKYYNVMSHYNNDISIIDRLNNTICSSTNKCLRIWCTLRYFWNSVSRGQRISSFSWVSLHTYTPTPTVFHLTCCHIISDSCPEHTHNTYPNITSRTFSCQHCRVDARCLTRWKKIKINKNRLNIFNLL